MKTQRLIESLERFAGILPVVVGGLSTEDARWKPPGGGWSILEIVAHMADEETADFRTRVRMTLDDPNQPWPSIDPEGWAVERRYNDGVLAETVDRFVTARRESVAWLRALPEADWSKAYRHPALGMLRGGDIFVAWVAHDTLHLRQIAKRMYQMTNRDGGEFTSVYAGSWT